jgi:hypothetical protein
MPFPPPVKATTPAQKVALLIAHLGALVSVILVTRWAKGAGEGYLGGLDWGDDDLIFNWHPVLMVRLAHLELPVALRRRGGRGCLCARACVCMCVCVYV